MSPEVRRAALRAAAKVALVATAGCARSTAPTPAERAGAGCDDYLGSLATISPSELPPGDPLAGAPEVYGAFADVAARGAARTLECCGEELARDGASAEHRWACCSALGGQDMACTPWGPPVPPPMA